MRKLRVTAPERQPFTLGPQRLRPGAELGKRRLIAGLGARYQLRKLRIFGDGVVRSIILDAFRLWFAAEQERADHDQGGDAEHQRNRACPEEPERDAALAEHQ